ncbi:hypothetical protein ABH935_005358 [Catenulispora sp. GAS73]|uniref:DUF2637 domain-containing protein n=1 Tax=Catenulispora sp. GAS73 TaxID=3156269 RepID=UPI003511821C
MLTNTLARRAVLAVVLIVLSGLAITSGILSFGELQRLSIATGGSPSTAYLAPFSVDAFGAVVTLVWVALAKEDGVRAKLATVSYSLAFLSVAGNAIERLGSAHTHSVFWMAVTVVYAAIPPLALTGSTHLFVVLLSYITPTDVAAPIATQDATSDTQTADEFDVMTEMAELPQTPPKRGQAPWKTLPEPGKLARVTRKSDLLTAAGKPVTAKAIADMCGTSERTAGTYLRKLRKVEGGRVPYENPAPVVTVDASEVFEELALAVA